MAWVRIEIGENRFYLNYCSITTQVIGHIRQYITDDRYCDTWVLDLAVFNEGHNQRTVLKADLSKFSYSNELLLGIQYKEGEEKRLEHIKVLSCRHVEEPVPTTILN